MKTRFTFILIILGIGLVITYRMIIGEQKKDVLPIINPIDLDEQAIDSNLIGVGYGHQINPFSFKNQYNMLITENEMKNNISVVEYFFTSCGTICPKMNVQMKRIQENYKTNKAVKLFSFTVNPEIDSIPIMKMYADTKQAIKGKWHFLTGDKKRLYEAARKSFFVLKPAEAQNLGDAGGDFIHTNNFVLIDKKLKIRGYYDGTSEKVVNQLIKDINILMAE